MRRMATRPATWVPARLTVLLLTVLLLAGCGASSADSEPTARQLASPSAATRTRAGTLGGDARLEGGCVWLDTDDGRIEIVWPDGWTADADPVELRDPSGGVVAAAGDDVRIDGSPAPDAVSTCQVGEIWTATAVSAD